MFWTVIVSAKGSVIYSLIGVPFQLSQVPTSKTVLILGQELSFRSCLRKKSLYSDQFTRKNLVSSVRFIDLEIKSLLSFLVETSAF